MDATRNYTLLRSLLTFCGHCSGFVVREYNTNYRHGLRVQGLRSILVGQCGSTTVKDLAWSYKTPLPESVKIAGFVAFYNERADFTVDGERQVRPKTKFS